MILDIYLTYIYESPNVRVLMQNKGLEFCEVEVEVRSRMLKAASDGLGKHQILLVSLFVVMVLDHGGLCQCLQIEERASLSLGCGLEALYCYLLSQLCL